MEIGFIGLGRMGGNMVIRLAQGGHRVVAFNRTYAKTEEVAKEHPAIVPAKTIEEMVAQLHDSPKLVWIMVPNGKPVDDQIDELMTVLKPGDIIIDGGNSNFHESQARAKKLTEAGFHFMDAGVSGGIWGLTVGYALMVGGEKDIYDHVEPIFKTLAPEDGYGYMGTHGAGHFVKMVHNGIEYGMLQAYGEGFEIMKKSPDYGEGFDMRAIARLWNHGSVVRSWLLELAERAFARGGDLPGIKGYVQDSGEGRWTVQAAIDEDVPAPVITLSLLARFNSRQDESYSAKVIAALRNEFGGHAVLTDTGLADQRNAPEAVPNEK